MTELTTHPVEADAILAAHRGVQCGTGECRGHPVCRAPPCLGDRVRLGAAVRERGQPDVVCRTVTDRLDGIGEAVVLADHVPEQGVQVPPRARGGAGQIGLVDADEHGTGDIERAAVQRAEIRNCLHWYTVCLRRRYVKVYGLPVNERRSDLGELLHRLARAVLEAEVPALAGHDVEMWDYVVLAGLEHGAAPTQSRLARLTGRDKTRLIPILDRLEARGLLRRTPDPDDRRNRVVTLTADGRALLAACRRSIRALEDDLLADLPPAQRAALLATLQQLAASIAPPPD